MFEVASTRQQPNRHMEDIIAAIRKVTTPGKAVNATMPYFSLSELMPENPSYMRYLGSLTTPPCYEAVFWTVMTTPLKITETQLEVFRSLLKAQDSAGEKKLELIGRRSEAVRRELRLMDNFRPLQPSNERNVTFYEAPTDSNGILTTTAAPNPTANVKLQRMQLPMITESTWTWAGTTNATSHHGGPTTPTTRTAGETSSKGKQRNSADQPRSSRFALAVLFTVWLKSLGLS
jgi:Eukaryotic-type carbonic anhydrase